MPAAEPLPPPVITEDSAQLALPTPPPSLQLTPLLGAPQSEHLDTLHSLYASSVATLVWTHEAARTLGAERRAVVIGIALRKGDEASGGELSEHERKVFFGVMERLRELLTHE